MQLVTKSFDDILYAEEASRNKAEDVGEDISEELALQEDVVPPLSASKYVGRI